jgi:hypothetical protein
MPFQRGGSGTHVALPLRHAMFGIKIPISFEGSVGTPNVLPPMGFAGGAPTEGVTTRMGVNANEGLTHDPFVHTGTLASVTWNSVRQRCSLLHVFVAGAGGCAS